MVILSLHPEIICAPVCVRTVTNDSTSGSRMADPNSHTFGQRQPPLSVTIKAILERYPDGQIFKVMNFKRETYFTSRSVKIRERPRPPATKSGSCLKFSISKQHAITIASDRVHRYLSELSVLTFSHIATRSLFDNTEAKLIDSMTHHSILCRGEMAAACHTRQSRVFSSVTQYTSNTTVSVAERASLEYQIGKSLTKTCIHIIPIPVAIKYLG